MRPAMQSWSSRLLCRYPECVSGSRSSRLLSVFGLLCCKTKTGSLEKQKTRSLWERRVRRSLTLEFVARLGPTPSKKIKLLGGPFFLFASFSVCLAPVETPVCPLKGYLNEDRCTPHISRGHFRSMATVEVHIHGTHNAPSLSRPPLF